MQFWVKKVELVGKCHWDIRGDISGGKKSPKMELHVAIFYLQLNPGYKKGVWR